MRSFKSAKPVLPLIVALVACPGLDGPDPVSGPPCEDDVNGCGDGSTFVEDPTCELMGELELELGQGQNLYSSLGPGEMPEIYSGPQGGRHVWLGVRVKNPDLERPSLEINITLSGCESGCDDPEAWWLDNSRELVIGSQTITSTEEGWFEEEGMLVTLAIWDLAAHRRVEMVVTDPCGRQGLVVAED